MIGDVFSNNQMTKLTSNNMVQEESFCIRSVTISQDPETNSLDTSKCKQSLIFFSIYSYIKPTHLGWICRSLVQYLPRTHEALGLLTLKTTKQKCLQDQDMHT
jgi:hypothetical protein